MILQALYDLAQREGLMEDPDFEPKPVAWLVRLSDKGELLGIVGTHVTGPGTGKGPAKGVAKPFMIPRQPTGKSGTKAPASFFVDNAKYVFGLTTKDKKFSAKEGQEKCKAFRDLIAECAAHTSDQGANAVLKFLEDVAQGHVRISLDEKCNSNDLFAFVVSPDTDQLVHQRDQVRNFWKQKRRTVDSEKIPSKICLVSGKPTHTNHLFPLIRKVPGKGTAKGIALVSFNKSAFKSYGWEGNANAPISRDAAESCSTALNRLLHPAYPKQSGGTWSRRNLQLSSDTVVCFWSPKPDSDFCSAFAGLLEANPDEVKELYRSLWRGKLADIDDPSAFYALTLSGTQGRAIVRDWFESTVAVVAHNLASHFQDLKIVRYTPLRRDLSPQLSLRTLLEALATNGKKETIPPQFAAAMVQAALHGTQYPLSILQRAIERTRAEIGRKPSEISKQKWEDIRDARAALIKAVLNRRRRFLSAPHYQEVLPAMDPLNNSQGYILGRLLAVLECLQQTALGKDVNATVVDRYFSGASASPKSVFVRLLKNARHHVSKIKGDGSKYGLALRLDRIVDEVAERFDPKDNGFPAHLDLEQQGLFILGYHQMRNWLRLYGEERDLWEKEHPTAPRPYLWNANQEFNAKKEEEQSQ
jgi:CRISPR-associated protein Csd1